MKLESSITTNLFVFLAIFLLNACEKNNNGPGHTPETTCYIHLFDGENYKGDNIIIEGAGEYPHLNNLPGSGGKDWTDEADSFKIGETATVIVWARKNFQGDSIIYQPGNYPDVDEPASLKIICNP